MSAHTGMEDNNAEVVNKTLDNFKTKIGNEYSSKGIISIFNNKSGAVVWIRLFFGVMMKEDRVV